MIAIISDFRSDILLQRVLLVQQWSGKLCPLVMTSLQEGMSFTKKGMANMHLTSVFACNYKHIKCVDTDIPKISTNPAL